MVAKVNYETKSGKLVAALENGEQLTEAQIRSRFKIANPTATVSSLRLNNGLSIYGNQVKNSEGKTVTKYRLGTPSKRVVAAGFQALAAARKLGIEI
jgi:hypothetical protein